MNKLLRFRDNIVTAKIVLLMVVLALPGCDSHKGVVREMGGKASITQSCITEALEKTAGVANIKHVPVNKTESYQHNFYDYKHRELSIRLSVILNSSNVPNFAHVYSRNHRPPPQHEIDIVRSLMAEVERNLEAACNLSGIATSVKERCLGVHCPPFALSNAPPNE